MKKMQTDFKDKALLKKKILAYPFRNFGRLDNTSRMTCYAVALALKDAGIKHSLNQKHDIGIIGTNTSGSLQSDIDYFKDYLDSGRTLGRGNLFIYTIPTSPLAEAAIYFGLQGPLLYMAFSRHGTAEFLRDAGNIIVYGETSAMLAVKADEAEAVCFVLIRNADSNGNVLCNTARAETILGKDLIFPKMIKEFSSLRKGKSSR